MLFEFSHTGENWNCSAAETFISLPSAAYKKHWAHKHCHNTYMVVTLYTRNCMANSHILIYNLKHEYNTCGPKHSHKPLHWNGYK